MADFRQRGADKGWGVRLKGVLRAETAAGRLRLLRVVLALATLCGFALSRRLWLSAGRTFPTVPVFDFLPRGPAPFDLVWLLALAAMSGRDFATPDDVKAIALPVLRHRISLRAEAELDGATPDAVITDILNTVEVPR